MEVGLSKYLISMCFFCVKEVREGRRGRKIRHLTTAFLASFSGATASSQKKKKQQKLPDLGVVREGRGLQFRARCLSSEISSSFVNCGFLFSSHVLSGKIKQIDNETSPAIPNAQLLFFFSLGCFFYFMSARYFISRSHKKQTCSSMLHARGTHHR